MGGPAAIVVPESASGLDGWPLRRELRRAFSGQVGVKPVNQLLGQRRRHWRQHHNNS
ncbi:MAG TPA: hypothetical protein VE844_07710 [Gammaproteobacteria bacterium]|nr:hypothetical protein [Gammaproteobacteria bacterium]